MTKNDKNVKNDINDIDDKITKKKINKETERQRE